jgi:hypothetical protein
MATTHDIAMQGYKDEYVPDTAPADHWSNSPEWMEFLKAKADAVRLYPAFSAHTGRKADTPEMQAALEKFNAKYPPEVPTPAPTQTLSARDVELQAAQIDLRRAVGRMRIFAHPLAIVDLVSRMLNE